MRIKLIDWWLRLQESYWFVPSLMVMGALSISLVLVQFDSRIGQDWLLELGWIYANQPDGARALLSTVAGSMITVAGVTFSMTLLAVSHATSQIGAHLLVAFMRDRGNQLTLGTFIATFLYCLMVLRTVRTGIDGADGVIGTDFVPHVAILVGMLFAILSVVVLIYFIHHVPQSINVANVIARVGDDLVRGVHHFFPEKVGIGASDKRAPEEIARPAALDSASRILRLDSEHGYLRVVDDDTLMELAVEHDLVLELLRRPGDFAVPGKPLLRAWPRERITDDIAASLRAAFSWGAERTANQDVLLPVEQLLEVMGKALSPGINNQFTARLCIDQLSRGLAAMLCRDIPDRERLDEDGHLRVIAQPLTHADFAAAIFGPMRQYVEGDDIATDHLLDTIAELRAMPTLRDHALLLAAESSALEHRQGRKSTASASTTRKAGLP